MNTNNFMVSTEIVTPKIASYYLSAKFHYSRGRKEKKDHTEFLAGEMKKGRFNTSQVSFGCVHDGRDYLINGQHTLNAIIKSELAQNLNLIHHYVNSYDEVHHLYARIDIGSGRTIGDIINVYNVLARSNLNSKTQINMINAGLRYINSGFPRGNARGKLAHEDTLDRVVEWKKESIQIFKSLSGGDKIVGKRLITQPSMAVLLVIMRCSPVEAVKFIKTVVSDDGLRIGDPCKALHNYLRETRSRAEGTGKKAVQNGEVSRAVAKAWGKYISNVSYKVINITKDDIRRPIVIKQTPYIGKFYKVGLPKSKLV